MKFSVLKKILFGAALTASLASAPVFAADDFFGPVTPTKSVASYVVKMLDTYSQLNSYAGKDGIYFVREAGKGQNADPSVGSGWAVYVYDGRTSRFKLITKQEAMGGPGGGGGNYLTVALYQADINPYKYMIRDADALSKTNAVVIADLKNADTLIVSSVNELAATVGAMSESVGTAVSTVAAMGTRVDDAEASASNALEVVQGLQTTVGGLSSTVGTLSNNYTALDEKVDTTASDVRGYTDTKIADLKIDIITNTAVRMRGTLTTATNFTNQVKVETLAAAASDAESKDATLADTLRGEIGTAKTEAVGAAKDYTDGKTEGLLSAATAEATYQPKGDYLTEHQDISGKANVGDAYTKAESDAKYLTEHQDISGKLDASTAAETYQPKGSYLVPADIEGKADKSFLFKNNLFYNELVYGAIKSIFWNETTGGGIRLENSDTGVKSAFSVNDGGGGGIYGQIYAVKKIDDKSTGTRITITDNGAFYTVTNTYMWTSGDEIAVKRDLSAYQPAGAYLVAADIEGKLDATVAAETYQPKGNYVVAGDALELPLKVKKGNKVYVIDVVGEGEDLSLSVNEAPVE